MVVVELVGNIRPVIGEWYGLVMFNWDHTQRHVRVDLPRGRAKSFHWEKGGCSDLMIGIKTSGATLAALRISVKSSSCSSVRMSLKAFNSRYKRDSCLRRDDASMYERN